MRRLRFTSPYPTDFTDGVVAAMAETPAVCEHVHLPVQSGSSRVLKRMLRRYDRDRYLEVVAALRGAVPGMALTTDIIVGFPGETEDDFQETLSLVALVEFDDAYTFKYSLREGTPATRLKDPVPDAVAGERLERLVAVVRGIARRRNVALVGSTHEVLVEGRAKRGELLQGRTRTNKVALIAGPDAWIGGYRDVRFTGTTGSTDRKSTRLNSSHGYISYAVFCLKKKKKQRRKNGKTHEHEYCSKRTALDSPATQRT